MANRRKVMPGTAYETSSGGPFHRDIDYVRRFPLAIINILWSLRFVFSTQNNAGDGAHNLYFYMVGLIIRQSCAVLSLYITPLWTEQWPYAYRDDSKNRTLWPICHGFLHDNSSKCEFRSVILWKYRCRRLDTNRWPRICEGHCHRC